MSDALLPGILPTLHSVETAAGALRAVFPPTPLRQSAALCARVGVPVWLKLECEQVTGSFKVRGAYTVLHRMAPEARARGVVASSAGNHGLGVAWAAHHFGAPATLYVPRHAPQVKKDGIAALGATVDDRADDYDHAMVLAKAHAERAGIPFINPCLGEDLLAGQGTVALEILDQCPDVREVFVCVGGGGLLGGVGAVLRRRAPSVRITGAQSVRTAAMARSVAAGHVVEIASERTLADGLAGQIDDDALAIGQQCLDDIVTLSEAQIGEAIAWLHAHEGLRVEGAGAVTVAALLAASRAGVALADGPVVAIVSGRNIDASRHALLLAEWGAEVAHG
jgi:threonine dehydratase